MKTYLVKWNSGYSLAVCKNTEELYWLLDEEANPREVLFKEIDTRLLFDVKVKVHEDGYESYDLRQIGEGWACLGRDEFHKDFDTKFLLGSDLENFDAVNPEDVILTIKV